MCAALRGRPPVRSQCSVVSLASEREASFCSLLSSSSFALLRAPMAKSVGVAVVRNQRYASSPNFMRCGGLMQNFQQRVVVHGASLGRKQMHHARSNYAFKPTAGEVIRTNQPLLAGGGLTRR